MNKLEALLVALNTKIVSRLGVALFVPALTMLMNPHFAAAFLSQFSLFKHLPDTDLSLAGAMLAGISAALLYQGQPEKTKASE